MSAQWGYYEAQRAPQPAFEYAGWWWRGLAAIVDGLVYFAFLLIPIIAFAAAGYLTLEDDDTADLTVNLASLALGLVFALIYYPLTMKRAGHHNGQTWGKQACNIRVVRTDGQPMDAQTAIMR